MVAIKHAEFQFLTVLSNQDISGTLQQVHDLSITIDNSTSSQSHNSAIYQLEWFTYLQEETISGLSSSL